MWTKLQTQSASHFPKSEAKQTKWEVLSYLARVNDPLGIVSPLTLCGKFVFRDICDKKPPWDASLNEALARRWRKWLHNLPEYVPFPRPIVQYRETVNAIELHSFGVASSQGVCAAVYAVVQQDSGSTQGLITAKSRLSKRNLIVSRLELTGGHMAWQ